MVGHDLIFSSNSLAEAGSYKLLEIPPDLVELFQNAGSTSQSICIKGHPTEDAVLCTSDKTYNIRTIVLSNTVLVTTPPPDVYSEDSVAIRDQVNEILELTRAVPRLHKIDSLLKRDLYNGEDEEMDDDDAEGGLSYEDLLAQVQSSPRELDAALKKRRVLNLRGRLRQISPAHLHSILKLMLNELVSLSLTNISALPVQQLARSLDVEHEIPQSVSWQIMEWFGEIAASGQGSQWNVDVPEIVKETGLGILRDHKDEPIEEDVFVKSWKDAVGDTFEPTVDMALLSGNYLTITRAGTDRVLLTYFPTSSLPSEPAARFQDLFLTRSRWKSADITPFLTDIAVDTKERDKLLLKFARATTDAEGVWYTARTMFMG